MPYWLGRLAHERPHIAHEFARLSVDSGLVSDLSTKETDRLYGQIADFVSSCKAMLGVESGASIIDFDGEIERTVDAYVAQQLEVSFEHVYSKFLEKQINRSCTNSSRCFEAAALRMPMVLFEEIFRCFRAWKTFHLFKRFFKHQLCA